jgi:exopolyphosphatase/guanosine-5'-triphosphate,3'-diphosphate pyrophosphatase
MGMSKKRAAIDLGTNSFRMLIADIDGWRFTPIKTVLCTVRLGEQFSDNKLTTAAVERGVAAVAAFRQQLDDYPDIQIIACGSAVFRQAKNSHDFRTRAEAILGAKIQVLTAAQEAYLSRLGCLSSLTCQDEYVITIDAGGGSTELSFAPHNTSTERLAVNCSSISIPVGAVSLTERFLKTAVRTEANIKKLRKSARQLIGTELDNWQNSLNSNFGRAGVTPTLIASGGTATALACLDLKLYEYDAAKVQGHLLHRKAMDTLLQKLTNLSPAQANALPGLDNRRGEIIIAGLVVLEIIIDFWQCKHLLVSDSGLLEGILLAG